ncbi:uncharacterized protein B0T23DRAFT_374339 [Neurospora hispaniola]|uniref:Uncharacterized protein n=1 Tax=Neurospora hispaniola TaxID=588809 RepID=A0AAJ0MTW8_9PEZI|nr:hypothetical protein B0T23DRAFT_374339 [Neurospora hispaniola]
MFARLIWLVLSLNRWDYAYTLKGLSTLLIDSLAFCFCFWMAGMVGTCLAPSGHVKKPHPGDGGTTDESRVSRFGPLGIRPLCPVTSPLRPCHRSACRIRARPSDPLDPKSDQDRIAAPDDEC